MSGLTERERQTVLLRLSVGLSTKQAAAELGLQPSTIKQYMHSAYSKLGPAELMRLTPSDLAAAKVESPK